MRTELMMRFLMLLLLKIQNEVEEVEEEDF